MTTGLVTLRFSPEIAEALGSYVAEFATLEYLLETFVGMLLDIGKGKASDEEAIFQRYRQFGRAILGSVTGFLSKCDILENLASTEFLRVYTMAEKFTEFSKGARLINVVRNQYVHGTYVFDPVTKTVTLHPFETSANRKTTPRIITKTEIDNERDRITTLILSIIPSHARWTAVIGVVPDSADCILLNVSTAS